MSVRIPDNYIPCDLLVRAVGYPQGYAAAERVLHRNGWHYLISRDAWINPRAGGAAPGSLEGRRYP